MLRSVMALLVTLGTIGVGYSADRVSTAVPTYPTLSITPSSPTDKDSVVVQMLLGSASCYPTYTTGYYVEEVTYPCLVAPCPVANFIHVKYAERSKICIDCVCPPNSLCEPCSVPYGPSFALGKLVAGSYYLIFQSDTFAFTVSRSAPPKFAINGIVNGYYADPTLSSVQAILGARVILSRSLTTDPYSATMLPRNLDTALTDSKGFFSFPAFEQGDYRISVEKSGYANAAMDLALATDTMVRIMMKPVVQGVFKVRGRVYALDCPTDPAMSRPCYRKVLPGCTVSVYLPVAYRHFHQAVTKADGTYEIDSIWYSGTSPFSVRAAAPGYNVEKRSVYRTDTVTVVDFALSPIAQITGTTTIDGVVFTVSTDKTTYAVGESVAVRYGIVNKSMATVAYSFSSGCQFDMDLRTATGTTVYSYMADRSCPAVMTTLKLDPGQSTVMNFPAVRIPKGESRLLVGAQMIGYDRSRATVAIMVDPATSAKVSSHTAKRQEGLYFAAVTRSAALRINTPQLVTVEVLGLDGRLWSTPINRKLLGTGDHAIDLRDMPGGCAILRVQGTTLRQTLRIPFSR